MNDDGARQGPTAHIESPSPSRVAPGGRYSGVYGPLYDTLLAELAVGISWGPAWRAIQLGTSPEVAEALLRGETVPVERLDPVQMVRYGRRVA